MKGKLLFYISVIIALYFFNVTGSGCAQIGMPTGGAKDSLAPVLIKASPQELSINIQSPKISLNFDEYVEVKDVQQNVLVSPVQKNAPEIRYNFKTISVKLKDSLLPNTTYSINFGNSILDVNEGNVYKNYTYVFSTGSSIDSNQISGKLYLAETGKYDSTLMVLLYPKNTDSLILKEAPKFMARVNAEGNFHFKYLPAGQYNIYALKDGDGNKFYNSATEFFAFNENDHPISAALDTNNKISLYAYQSKKLAPTTSSLPKEEKPKTPKKLSYSLVSGNQDLLKPLMLLFNNKVTIDKQKIRFVDTSYKALPNYSLELDSTKTSLLVKTDWQPETKYFIIIDKDAAIDSLGTSLAKTDTIRFTTKRTEDYAKVVIRFTGLKLSEHPVLQLLDGDNIKFSYALTDNQWSDDLFPPGEYGIRILYDSNNNLQWDPGSYTENRQPERTINIPQKLALRANWENEREVKLDE